MAYNLEFMVHPIGWSTRNLLLFENYQLRQEARPHWKHPNLFFGTCSHVLCNKKGANLFCNKLLISILKNDFFFSKLAPTKNTLIFSLEYVHMYCVMNKVQTCFVTSCWFQSCKTIFFFFFNNLINWELRELETEQRLLIT